MKYLPLLLLYFLIAFFAGAILAAKLDQKTFEIGMADLRAAKEQYNEALQVNLAALQQQNKDCAKALLEAKGDLEVFTRRFH